MSVAVYSRLGEQLQARRMTVSDLQRQIMTRFGLAVEARVLDRLTREPRVRRPDVEIAAAAAAVLGVGLGDLFAVDAVPLQEHDAGTSAPPAEDDALLDVAHRQRLSALFALQDRRLLTAEEQAELDRLVATYGRAVSERGVHELARQRGVPVEQVRAEVLAEVERAQAWWQDLQADPARLEQAVREARAAQQARAVG